MAFIADRIKVTVADKDRDIMIVPIRRFTTDSTTLMPYRYRRNGIEFEFKVGATYGQRLVVDNSGKEHNLRLQIEMYIIEQDLRKSIDLAYNIAGHDRVSEQEYAAIKDDLKTAINLLRMPEAGVTFIETPAERSLNH